MSLRLRIARLWLCCRPEEMDDSTWRKREQMRRCDAKRDLEARNRHFSRHNIPLSPRPALARVQSDSILAARPTRLQALAAVHLPTGMLVPPPALARVRETEDTRPYRVPTLPSPRPRASPRSPLANEVRESPEEHGGYFGEQS